MNAHLSNRPELTPISAPSGFSILASESPSGICTSFTPVTGQCSDGNTSIGCASPSGIPLDDLQEAFSLTDDDPYLALRVRTSILDSSGYSLHCTASKLSDFEETEDVGNSTIDSLGPCTPPRLSCELIPSGKHLATSKKSPGFVSPGSLDLTEENHSASFIDFNETFFHNDKRNFDAIN